MWLKTEWTDTGSLSAFQKLCVNVYFEGKFGHYIR